MVCAQRLDQVADMTQIKADPRVHRKAAPVEEVKQEKVDAKEAAPKAAPKRRASRAKG